MPLRVLRRIDHTAANVTTATFIVAVKPMSRVATGTTAAGGMARANSRVGPRARSAVRDAPTTSPRRVPSTVAAASAMANVESVCTAAGHRVPLPHSSPSPSNHVEGGGKYGESAEARTSHTASSAASGSSPRSGGNAGRPASLRRPARLSCGEPTSPAPDASPEIGAGIVAVTTGLPGRRPGPETHEPMRR